MSLCALTPVMQVQQTVLGTFADVGLRTRGTRKQEDRFKAEVIPGGDTTRPVKVDTQMTHNLQLWGNLW